MDPYKIYYQCNIDGCPAIFPALSQIKKHRFIHTNQRPVECSVCNTQIYKANSARHLNSHKNAKAEFIETELSDETRKILNAPIRYIPFQEAAASRLQCTVCDKIFNTEKKINEHNQRFHSTISRNNTQKEMPGSQQVINLLSLPEAELTNALTQLNSFSELDSQLGTCEIKDTGTSKDKIYFDYKKITYKYLCNFKGCNFEGSTTSDVQRHRFEHTNQRPCMCSECNTPLFDDAEGHVHITKKHEKTAKLLPSPLSLETLAVLNSAITTMKKQEPESGNIKWHTEKIYRPKKRKTDITNGIIAQEMIASQDCISESNHNELTIKESQI